MVLECRLLVPGQPLRWCRAIGHVGPRRLRHGFQRQHRGHYAAASWPRKKRASSTAARAAGDGRHRHGHLGIPLHHRNTRLLSPECLSMLGYADRGLDDEDISLTRAAAPGRDCPACKPQWTACQSGEKELFACEHRAALPRRQLQMGAEPGHGDQARRRRADHLFSRASIADISVRQQKPKRPWPPRPCA